MRVFLAALFAVSLFFGLLACLRAGWRFGRARLRTDGEQANSGHGAIEGAVFALLGLLIAFTFNGAATRFDERRNLVVQEVNAIGTAWLRLELIDGDLRAETQALFRQYLDLRIETYAHVRDAAAVEAALQESGKLQNAIWQRLIVAAQRDPTPRIATTVLPPVNEMFDLANTRLLATRIHPPLPIFLMLGCLVLVSALFAGVAMAQTQKQSRLHMIGFAAILSLAIYLIIDLEYPRLGLVRVDEFDQAFLSLRESIE